MNERLAARYEMEPVLDVATIENLDDSLNEIEAYANGGKVEKSLGRTAMDGQGVIEKEPLDAVDIAQGILEAEAYANGETSIRRADGLVYAQDQPAYKFVASEAADIIERAFAGDLSALDSISRGDIRDALYDRIGSGNNEIDKMISVACIGLAPGVK